MKNVTGVRILLSALAMVLVGLNAHAEDEGELQAADERATRSQVDRLDLDATSVTGSRELPKVLYILPWKESAIGDLSGKPVNSLLDEVLAPLDRDVFLRQVGYYNQLQANEAGAAGGKE